MKNKKIIFKKNKNNFWKKIILEKIIFEKIKNNFQKNKKIIIEILPSMGYYKVKKFW